jgi:DNA-binding MarR family transcriptional regulator
VDENGLVEEAADLLPKLGKLFYIGLGAKLEQQGCSMAQLRVTGYLYQHGPATITEVAAGVGISLPTASELVEQLDDKGWVDRKSNPADRRQVVLELTPEARAQAERMRDYRRAQMRSALERLAPEERPVFVKSLHLLAEVMSEFVAHPPELQTVSAKPSRKLASEGVKAKGIYR